MKKYLFGLLSLCLSTYTLAAPNTAEVEQAWAAAEKVQVPGPTKITIANQAEVTIPEGYSFIPKAAAQRAMTAMGNSMNESLEGLIVPSGDNPTGLFTVDYNAEGYIKDDDAKDLNAKDILADYKAGTEEGNKERTAKGFNAIEVSGWAQEPVYDQKLHRLTWALKANAKGVAPSDKDTVNHQTRILGREGVISVTWLSQLKNLDGTAKSNIDTITSGVQYVDGKKYENFSASAGDKVAEYGLATLITGVAAKKLGLFAVIAAFLAKFAKFGVIALFAAFPFLKKVFKKKDKTATEPTEPESQTTPTAESTVANQPVEPVSNTPTDIQAAQSQTELKDTTKL